VGGQDPCRLHEEFFPAASPLPYLLSQAINKSLSALGDVISALATEQQHIPYRNHKLTMLMSDSLGGNAKTLMFVNVSPTDGNIDETQNSLQYATRVRTIKVGPGFGLSMLL